MMGGNNVGVSGAKLFMGSEGSLFMGRSEFWPQHDPFKVRGHQHLGESTRALFHLIVSISTSLMHTRSYARSWVCTQCLVGGHVA
jgi:hypothetical protein